ncbi:hypothetical protein O9929_21110 [Vibrio lentus]|nr:hypothetical protein [Vibrio lentus]
MASKTRCSNACCPRTYADQAQALVGLLVHMRCLQVVLLQKLRKNKGIADLMAKKEAVRHFMQM